MMKKTMLVLAVLAMGTMANAELIHYWDCDTITGSGGAGSTIAANVGDKTLNVWTGTSSISTDAARGTGSVVSGQDSYIQTNGLSNTLTAGTFSMWVKVTGASNNYGRVITTNLTGTSGNPTRLDLAGSVSSLNLYDIPNGGSVGTGINLNDGAWHQLVLTYDNVEKKARLYADGVLNNEAAYSAYWTGPNPVLQYFTLSAISVATMVDDVAIFDSALNAEQVAYIYNNPIPEPATMSLLLAGAAGVFIRRKKSL